MESLRGVGSACAFAFRSIVQDRKLLAWSIVLAAFVAVALGIPTDIVPNPWFTRMTPIYTDQYVWWITTSLLGGALLATYVVPRESSTSPAGSISGGILGYLAIGCPVCNKIVVGLIGFSGALNYFAPIQPILGALSVLLAGIALTVRLNRGADTCLARQVEYPE